MRALVILALCATLQGCDNPDNWEYCISIPGDTPPERIMEIRNNLKSNSYKRFKIYTVDFGRAIVIHATESEADNVK